MSRKKNLSVSRWLSIARQLSVAWDSLLLRFKILIGK